MFCSAVAIQMMPDLVLLTVWLHPVDRNRIQFLLQCIAFIVERPIDRIKLMMHIVERNQLHGFTRRRHILAKLKG
ncbi:hypothetical protein D3C76_1599920 [compost metagenome]